jgi:hypothetical protein
LNNLAGAQKEAFDIPGCKAVNNRYLKGTRSK